MNKFESFTDPTIMKTVLQQQLPEFRDGNLVINQCVVGRAHYKHVLKESSRRGSMLSVVYVLDVTNRCDGQRGQQSLYARAYLGGRSRKKFRQAESVPAHTPCFGAPLTLLPEQNMIVWAFPNDPRLLQLPDLIEPHRVKHHFPYDRLPAQLHGPDDLTEVIVNLIRYRPPNRATIRYDLYWPSSKAQQPLALFGKTLSDATGEAVCPLLEHLWTHSLNDPDCFRIGEPLGYREAVKTLWQSALPGVPLVNILDQTNCRYYLGLVGRGLASLHNCGLPHGIGTPPSDLLLRTRTDIEQLMQAVPHLTNVLRSILAQLENQASCLFPAPRTLVYGTFRLSELLADAGQLGLCDFDDLSVGDPVQDLGYFLTNLYLLDFDPPLVQSMTTAFLEAYAAHVDWDIPVARLNWYTRNCLLSKANDVGKGKPLRLVEASVKPMLDLAQTGLIIDAGIDGLSYP